MKPGQTIFIYFMIFVIHSLKILPIGAEDVYYAEEREALIQIRELPNSAHLHKAWTARPCRNNNSYWVGIECWNSHVVSVVLDGIQLAGSLPPTCFRNISFLSKLSLRNNSLFGPLPDLTNLNHLQFVVLSNNHFTGSIPLEYINLPNLSQLELQENLLTGTIPPFNQTTLTVFNVSGNRLEGQIPETPVLLKFPKSSYDNNLGLCGKPVQKQCPPPSPDVIPSKKSKHKPLKIWGIALIAVAAVLVPFTVMLVFLCYFRRMHGKGATGEHSEASVEQTEKGVLSSESRGDPERTVELEFFGKDRQIFDLDDLLRASAQMLGRGKLGSAYKAILESGSAVVVKRLKEMNGLSKKEFVQQMQLLGNLKHENLVEIIAFYYSKDEKLVVYDFVQGGSLFELLHDNRGAERVPLNSDTRLSIVKGIARGLAYLHQSLPSHKAPHANLKSPNILIQYHNQNYNPKLTDFGFEPLIPPQKLAETLAVGKAPEVSEGKKLTHKADVYCFGLIMLEVVTGRIPGEFSAGNNDASDDLSEWVRSVVHQDWSTDILDLEIRQVKEGHEEMLELTEIALKCTSSLPESRPKMSEVLKWIEEIREGSEPRSEARSEARSEDVSIE
ncbi:putative leucine-rich repeat receptor-like protein kinase [Cinnamomum micranthum f. kanehirae]|uniref:Putative leucine-rich repeat receptor-like protein kinase n=1 Tax=Cinnamomum micranthum f. kanehirae TaxID=337451 RepID=A0A3S3N3E6_9MAGN|nr:putative leucine-rich repeat receptor-like protein kinase [Cinnamomum micranthum f. kanehirae]